MAAVNSQSSDQSTTQSEEQPDIFAGIPSLDELAAEKDRGIKYAAGLHQLRSTLEPLSAQHKELSEKYQPFEQFTQTPEELQSVVSLNASLNRYSHDPVSGVLRPDPSEFVSHLATEDPVRADYLAGELLWSKTTGANGQPVTRAEVFLQNLRQDPEMRSFALNVLGGVEPAAVPAPTWAPSPEELSIVKPELQDTYRKLPYDKRESLKLNDPDFINEYLEDQKFKADVRERDQQNEARQREYYESQQKQAEQEANNAGDQYVENGFRETFTSFAKHISETWKPTDHPEINQREGALVALAVAALAHPDTRFAAEHAFKALGIDEKSLDAFNQARQTYAQTGRQFGYLSHKQQRTTEDPVRAQQKLITRAKDLGTLLIKGRNEYFKARAESHNKTLDQTETARPPIGGSPQASQNGKGNRFISAGKRTSEEIWGPGV